MPHTRIHAQGMYPSAESVNTVYFLFLIPLILIHVYVKSLITALRTISAWWTYNIVSAYENCSWTKYFSVCN